MNKQSPEYIRVREEIAKNVMSLQLNVEEPLLTKMWNNASDAAQQVYCKDADSILEIKGIGIISDKQNLPHKKPSVYGGTYESGQEDMLAANFKRLVE